MFKKNVKWLLLAVVVSLLVSCSEAPMAEHANVKPASNRKPAPDFTLKDSNGTAVKLSDYKGKVVLLNFWATWCGPCKIEIPWFIDFEQQYKDKGFAVLGVAMDDEGWEVVKPYLAARKVNYRVLLGDDSVSQLYGGIDSLPTTFILDKDGNIASVHVGLVGKDNYQSEIQHLLGISKTAQSRAAGHAMPALFTLGASK